MKIQKDSNDIVDFKRIVRICKDSERLRGVEGFRMFHGFINI